MLIKIGLLGFGRTGSFVAKEIANDPTLSLEWVCRKNLNNHQTHASLSLGYKQQFAPFLSFDQLNKDFLEKNPVDIVIDFSAASAIKSYSLIAESGVRIVSAISKYSLDEVEIIKALSQKTAILYSPNITLGINWLIIASKVLNKIIPEADIEVIEQHFKGKKEVSGTALKIAEHLNLDANNHVNSIRVGSLVGTHEVIFGLKNQMIRLIHESTDRGAFGAGAIYASKWLINKKPDLYSMEQVFRDKFLEKIKELY